MYPTTKREVREGKIVLVLIAAWLFFMIGIGYIIAHFIIKYW